MKHALINEAGFPTAFYSTDVHGENIPEDAIALTEAQWREFIENQGRRKWVDGEVVEYAPPPVALTVADYQRAVEAHVDTVAGAKGYSSGVSCASYVGSTNTAWAAEAAVFVAWRDAVWGRTLTALATWQGGGDAPTIEGLIGDLPEIEWP